jgi:hypothetical protein
MPAAPVEQNDLANVLGIVTAGASLMGGNPLPAVGFMAQRGAQQQPQYYNPQPYQSPMQQQRQQYGTSWYGG